MLWPWNLELESLHSVLYKRVSKSFFNSSMRIFFPTKVLFLLTKTLKYTLFPLNHPHFPKYLFLRKMQTRSCRREIVEEENQKTDFYLIFCCTFSLFKIGILYGKLILRKADFKFSSTENLFRLFNKEII